MNRLGFLLFGQFVYPTLSYFVITSYNYLQSSLIYCPVKKIVLKSTKSNHLVLLISLLTINFLINKSSAYPMKNSESLSNHLVTKRPKWINPCSLPIQPIGPEDFIGGPSEVKIQVLLQNVISRANAARNHAEHIKRKFLEYILKDATFEKSVEFNRLDWLPKIPSTSDQVFNQISPDEAFKLTYEFLQYYAVGLEVILQDQILYDGIMIPEIKRDLEYNLGQLLCEIRYGMYKLKIKPRPDILRDVMSHEYPDLPDGSRRKLRDYLILRDYIAAANFTAALFSYEKSKISDFMYLLKTLNAN